MQNIEEEVLKEFDEKFPQQLLEIFYRDTTDEFGPTGSSGYKVKNNDIKFFISQSLEKVRENERARIVEILDGQKEVYKDGEDKGKEKYCWDSCCNEVLDSVIHSIFL